MRTFHNLPPASKTCDAYGPKRSSAAIFRIISPSPEKEEAPSRAPRGGIGLSAGSDAGVLASSVTTHRGGRREVKLLTVRWSGPDTAHRGERAEHDDRVGTVTTKPAIAFFTVSSRRCRGIGSTRRGTRSRSLFARVSGAHGRMLGMVRGQQQGADTVSRTGGVSSAHNRRVGTRSIDDLRSTSFSGMRLGPQLRRKPNSDLLLLTRAGNARSPAPARDSRPASARGPAQQTSQAPP
jgi:hypothetical protein